MRATWLKLPDIVIVARKLEARFSKESTMLSLLSRTHHLPSIYVYMCHLFYDQSRIPIILDSDSK